MKKPHTCTAHHTHTHTRPLALFFDSPLSLAHTLSHTRGWTANGDLIVKSVGFFLSGHCPLCPLPVSRVFPFFSPFRIRIRIFLSGRVIGPPASPFSAPLSLSRKLRAPSRSRFIPKTSHHPLSVRVCLCDYAVSVCPSGWACVHLCACCVEFFHCCSFGHLQFILVISQHSARIRHLICLQNGTNLLILMRLPFSYIV